MATHSSILAREIPWTKEPKGLQSKGSQESDMTQRLKNNIVLTALGTRSEKKMKAATSTFFPNFQYFCNNEKWLWQSDFEKLATIIYRVITHGLFKMNKEDREIHFLKGNNFKLRH